MGKARWTVVSAGIAAVLGAIAIVTGEVPGVVASRSARGGVDGEAWRAHLASVDRAIDEDDVSQAMRAWAEAYGASLGSRRWEAMLAVGLASIRIGRATGTLDRQRERARQCYLTALFRARHQKSAEGAYRVGEAFAGIGDFEAAARAGRLADRLARHEHHVDPSAAPLPRPEPQPVGPVRQPALTEAP